nr:hypothetical protein GCM10020063_044120 [Dactylosporangium thailandense]
MPVLWAVPKDSADRVLLCLHGGGYVGGSVHTHRKLYAHLAKAAGARAVLASYSHTPERQYPTQLDEVTAVYRALLAQTRPEHLAVTGDSAGGGLTVSLMLRARPEGPARGRGRARRDARRAAHVPDGGRARRGGVCGDRSRGRVAAGEAGTVTDPLPSGLGAPADDPHAPPGGADLEVPWLRPIADTLVTPGSADPAEVAATRDSLRLALIAGLQYLPPRQRAVLILREVLGSSVAGVKSLLQRARARLEDVAPSPDGGDLAEPGEPAARALLEQYIAAFERSDVTILERALRTDASLELVPSRTWFAGKATCVPYLRLVMGAAGEWRMAPLWMNGQPGVHVWYRGEPFGAAVLTVTTTGIRRIIVFGFPELIP